MEDVFLQKEKNILDILQTEISPLTTSCRQVLEMTLSKY
jgi:hypothetical protein